MTPKLTGPNVSIVHGDAGLMEALTQQIDNLTVPLVLLAALQLL